MGKKHQVPSRQCTDESKVEAVRLAESIGGNQEAYLKDLVLLAPRLWVLDFADILDGVMGG